MISILIPTYQYSIQELVKAVQKEAEALKIPYELIILDDASPIEIQENRVLDQLENVRYIGLSKNIGRTAARQKLASEAKHENLLFMDADVLPTDSQFLKTFTEEIDSAMLVFGGIAYEIDPPSEAFMLRWKYGTAREMCTLTERNKTPYASINSGCFMIKKSTFTSINKQLQQQRYGMDLLFKQLLEENNVSIKHIDNPVFHLGLETSDVFIKKSLQAVSTTVELEKTGALKADGRALQQKYLQLRRLGLLKPFRFGVKVMTNIFEKNFSSKNPNLFWFDLYRLSYYSKLKKDDA